MASPRMRYEFRDVLTNEKLDVLPLYGVNMTWNLHTFGNTNYGDFNGTFKAGMLGRSLADLLHGTTPGKTAVWAYRDDYPIWGGIVWNRTYASQSSTYQLYAQSFDAYLSRSVLAIDRAYDMDARNIIRELWLETYALGPEWNIGMELPAAVTDVYNTQKTLIATEQPVAGELARAMVESGAEFRVNLRLDGFTPKFSLELGRWDGKGGGLPIGIPAGQASPEVTYPGDITHYWYSESGSKAASHLYAIGKALQAGTPRSLKVNPDMKAMGYPGLAQKINLSYVEQQSVLDAQVEARLPLLQAPVASPSIKMMRNTIGFGTFNLGDYVYVIINDPNRFEEPLKQYHRVVSMSLSPESAGGREEFEFAIGQAADVTE
jgi:hypothetical protein